MEKLKIICNCGMCGWNNLYAISLDNAITNRPEYYYECKITGYNHEGINIPDWCPLEDYREVD